MTDHGFAAVREPGATLYGVVQSRLRQQIQDDEYPPGSKLPSESQLCADFRVSRPVVRQALKLLEDQGFIYRQHGKGTFVAEPGLQSQLMAVAVGPDRDTLRYRNRLRTEVLLSRLETAAAAVAREMQQGPGLPVVHLVRIRYLDGEPLAVLESYLPASLFAGLEDRDLTDESLYEVLEQHYGSKIHKLRRNIGVGALTDELADRLSQPMGTPYLRVSSLARLADGTIAENSIASYRGDKITLTTELEAEGDTL